MTERTQDQQRFHDLLPFYINGRLGDEDKRWMDDYVASHPEAYLWLRFDDQVRATIQSTLPPTPEKIRLERFLNEFQRIRRHRSVWRRILDIISQPRLVPAPAMALMAIVVLVQGLLITGQYLQSPEEDAVYRGGRLYCDKSPRIRVVFKPEATHGEVTILLRKVEGSLIAGPTDTGEYWVTVPPGRSVDETYAMLKSSILVDDVLMTSGVDAKCP